MGQPELPAADGDSVLAVRALAKTYGATQALRGVSFDLRPGRVYGLVGVNGSGKSTLMKIIAGAERPTTGEMTLDGARYRPRGVLHASRLGIGLVPQELPLVRGVSVADNVLIGQWPARFGVLRAGTQRHTAARALAEIGVGIDVMARAGDLNLAEQQLVVIARTLTCRPRIVLLDEPTSALSGADVSRLLRIVRGMAAQGRTVMLVSQRLDDVFNVCDHVMILRNGTLIESQDADHLDIDRVIDTMLNGPRDETDKSATVRGSVPIAAPAKPARWQEGASDGGSIALEVRGFVVPGRTSPLNLRIAQGEIVGLAGLPGSGNSEFLRGLFGILPSAADEIRLFDRPYRAKNIVCAIRSGIAYVTGDRQTEGLIPDASVATNIAAVRNRSARGGPRSLARSLKAALRQIVELRIRPGDPDVAARALSGGNQQKAVFGRWSLARPRLWLLDDATRGVDIGARRQIHDVLRRAIRDGGAAAVVSSDVLELFEVCDRIVVFRLGAVVERVAVRDSTPAEIEALATGALAEATS